ncbi:hypothetical protein [Chryseobacterium sp.]|uniref:hypothetical protein n=1 Tax=Chryseobacterium sp. TaxID=1871047 RepID=UPI00289E7A61|nr:hypothetical protein [Chryseobacterium sp.]
MSNTSWTKVDSKMLDGSRDLSGDSYRFLVWKINGSKMCEHIDPWAVERTKCVDLKFEKNLIRISDQSAYQVEKLTSDSLIVIQKTDGITFPDKIRKMWFVKTSTLVKDFTDKATGDSVVITSREVSPTLKKEFVTEMMDAYLQKKYTHDFDVEGEIRIFPKKQEIEVKMENKKWIKNNQTSIDLFKTTLQKNYKIWDITGFENFDKIIIPYRFKSKMEGSYGNMVFYNRIPRKEYKGIIININDKRASAENFQKGVEATNKQKYDNAIYFFNKAHEEDNTNTESLYNVVSISLALNNVNVACIALKKLKDLEQTQGTQLFKEKCTEQ